MALADAPLGGGDPADEEEDEPDDSPTFSYNDWNTGTTENGVDENNEPVDDPTQFGEGNATQATSTGMTRHGVDETGTPIDDPAFEPDEDDETTQDSRLGNPGADQPVWPGLSGETLDTDDDGEWRDNDPTVPYDGGEADNEPAWMNDGDDGVPWEETDPGDHPGLVGGDGPILPQGPWVPDWVPGDGPVTDPANLRGIEKWVKIGVIAVISVAAIWLIRPFIQLLAGVTGE